MGCNGTSQTMQIHKNKITIRHFISVKIRRQLA